ncbi:MAG: nucleoside triphosphate pyrophosphohydrolase [Geminicoccaceae bacterium]|nr:nucleoside triphosphate pyrophosphohydrolase [Geminicoccaceae bacterium]
MADGVGRLLEVMRRLRDPEGGCPWDLEQTFASIAPYTIEEAYEVADAVARGDMADLKAELGDLLLQVAYHARMAEEAGHFAFDEVAHGIADKMIARHPHVFGAAEIAGAEAQRHAWEATKAEERAARAAARGEPPSVLDDLPLALPALTRADKLQRRAARVGFDWPDAEGPRAKVLEELAELDAAPPESEAEELGDLLFAVVNLARKRGIDPEAALRAANAKFERRFEAIERAAGDRLGTLGLDALDALWDQAKRDEAKGG